MERIIHVILLLLGLCFPSSCVPHSQFVFFKTPKTWYEAQSYCREKCFDLATISSMTEMKTVLEMVKNQNYDAAWIGLWQGETATWLWSLADEDFYKKGERNYFISSMSISDYNCGFYSQGNLSSCSCGLLKYFVCFDGKKTGADQYIVISQSVGWTTARDYCRTYYTDLASLRNDAENQMIQNVSGQMTVWFGLFRDKWKWSDQSNSSMRYWRAGQSVFLTTLGTCGALVKREFGKWGEVPCREPHPFICDCRRQWGFVSLAMSVQDSVDLNDHAVQDSILNKMSLEMRKNEIDVYLRWKKHTNGSVFVRKPRRNN